MKRWFDVAAVAITLASMGFGTTLLLTPIVDESWAQPLLAGILAISGTGALLAHRLRNRRKEKQ